MPPTFIVETSGRLSHVEGMMADAALETRHDSAMTAKKAARFPRTARLLRHADFERVYKQGRRHFSASITVFYWARPEWTGNTAALVKKPPAPQGLRVGFTVGRALGGAVERNRMKRRLREAVRLSGLPAALAADVVINPKKSLLDTDFSVLLSEVSRAFSVIEQKLSQQAAERTGADGTRKPGSRKAEAGSR